MQAVRRSSNRKRNVSTWCKRAFDVLLIVFASGSFCRADESYSYSAPPVSITNMILAEADVSFELAEEGGDVYQLQTRASLNPAASAWETVATFTDPVVDVAMAAGEEQRFYRVILDPLANFLWTDSPETVGSLVVENMLARGPYDTNVDGIIHYAELCAADGAFDFVNLMANEPLYAGLESRYGCFMDPDCSLISPTANGQFQVSLVVLAMYNYNHNPACWQRALDLAADQWGKWAGGPPSYLRFWNDDMYFSATVNPRIFRLTGDTNCTYIATTQLSMYLDALQLPNGLIKHTKDVPFVWSRGAGWGAVGLTETLMMLPHDHPAREAIMTGYLNLMEGLVSFQADSGLWFQVVDCPHVPLNYEEASGTAMFTYAMATGLRYGWLDPDTYGPVVRKAWLGLVRNVDVAGNVRDICVGTNEKQTAEEYLTRPAEDGDFHGQAPLLWVANALILYQRSIGVPVISFADPTPATLQQGYRAVHVAVDSQGLDGTLESIDLYFDGTYMGELTNAPYVWHSDNYPALLGKPEGAYEMVAVATGTNQLSTVITHPVNVEAPVVSESVPLSIAFDSDTGLDRLAGISNIELVYTIDGSGSITLAAGTSDTGAPAAAVTEINKWSGSVGQTTHSTFFNTSFTLTATAKGTTTNGVDRAKDIRMDSSRSTLPVLGVSGLNSSRIDGWVDVGDPELESMLWTLSGAAVGLEFTAFEVDNAGLSAAMRVSDSDSTMLFTNLENGETRSLVDQGILITNGESVIFAAEEGIISSAGLAGLSFNVFLNP